MITNPEYIKMILALPNEFFEDWEWQEGDHAISLRDNKSEAIITEFDVWHDPKIIHVKFIGEIGFTYLFSLDNLRPIPSQEQLQKISKLDWDLYYHDLVKRYSNYDTAEQAGLAMIMYIKYGKRWDGETWVKI